MAKYSLLISSGEQDTEQLRGIKMYFDEGSFKVGTFGWCDYDIPRSIYCTWKTGRVSLWKKKKVITAKE